MGKPWVRWGQRSAIAADGFEDFLWFSPGPQFLHTHRCPLRAELGVRGEPKALCAQREREELCGQTLQPLNLAIGIGIQNFPEGLAVSLPLRGSGVSTWRSFWMGQLSGMVEPVSGLLGAAAVLFAEPLLPFALAFAAGAMVYVVVDDIIPEAQLSGNGKLASWTSILGFVVMMSLDVGLG
ncbi:hypothetical protein DNTS_008228 [Danionella cerebrum]|uniref:Zinc transporter ZIP11 n=1 Tax=Danionella cerebrum TaxID=2873325 RepID=A0A553NGI3_9TELE|nr:hypothetical protein DNTS_008228 [Danionella translucida]